jgi:hypothetical protein
MRKPYADILFEDAGILVYRADAAEARMVAEEELIDNGYSPSEAVEHLDRLKPHTGYWRKVPPTRAQSEDGYGWILIESKKGSGAFYGTWFH